MPESGQKLRIPMFLFFLKKLMIKIVQKLEIRVENCKKEF